MAAVLCLLVVVGVEVDVVEDDGVGRGQVDAQPARLGRQDEEEDAVVRVELVYQVLPADFRRRDSKQTRAFIYSTIMFFYSDKCYDLNNVFL